ncbi:hypothetical protein D9756_009734 [Leucocoprinus leucothites]|uniref:DUF6533 domain-containing protein n=1 Tax=Leucocoprinus leucothites TaxID=201217 RepID=A0A8H5CX00_9AGAR|nr:hypothetical protein D9756_009734 [Leucoagaricus leucothites]
MSSETNYAESLHQFQIYQLVNAAALTLYVFDYLLTIDQEISLVWASRWTWMKFLFLMDRYLMVANFLMQQFLIGTVEWDRGLNCQGLARAWDYLCTIELLLSEAILSLRLWAMWGNNKWLFITVLSMFIGTALWQQYDAEMAFRTGDYTFDPLLSHLSKGCVFDARVNHAGVAYLVTLTVDFGTVKTSPKQVEQYLIKAISDGYFGLCPDN